MTARHLLAAPGAVLLLVALAFSTVVRADDTVTRQFDVSGFTRIALQGSSELTVVQGDHFAVEASGPREAMELARAEVKGDTLKLSVESRHKYFGFVTISDDQAVEYRVTLPVVEAIIVTGSGEARADTLESEKLELAVTGSGELHVDKVGAQSLTASITGSGDLMLGTVLSVEAEASIKGSGDMRVDSLAGERLAAEIKGSGDMSIGGRVGNLAVSLMGSGDFVGRSLLADNASGSIMGSGDIVIRRPGKDSFSVMGSGDVALVD
ncbi:GIN domain-containing protein [Microbulbifer hainanensis]|uniref:GIN domain-containing protein n=1 Tax=Microbulbifer hainanensis TaxID=2735675 RepID=UPI0018675467|nr:DUF2807 domain-containing protein [Microbulbifer hainanensis]